MKLSIIIPVYNEEQTIGEVVERVRAVDSATIEKEMIIANDGSSDGTREAIDVEPLGRRPAHPHLRESDQRRQGRRGAHRA